MKKYLALFLSFLLLAQLPAPLAFASFDDQSAGARAPGMVDAFTAVADDADSIAYNPAGLVQLTDGQVTTQYSQLVKGLDDGSSLGTTYLGYGFPLMRGFRSMGVAYHNFTADNLFTERTLILSYGQRLDLSSFGWRGIYSIGGNVKQLHRQYEPDRFTENALNDAGVASNQSDALFSSGNAKDTYAFDLGALSQFGPDYQYTAGVAVINANQPDVSLGGDGDKAPMGVKTALAYRPKWGTATIESRRVKRLVGQTDQDLALGLERNFPFGTLGALVLRGGYATGSRGFRLMTMGMSYMYARFRLDYAFNFPIGNLAGTSGSHRIGFAFKLGANSAQLSKDYSRTDLLEAFRYDSLTSHILLTRISLARSFVPDEKDTLMLLLMRKYPLDDAGLSDVRNDLRELIQKYSATLMEWPRLKFALSKGVTDQDRDDLLNALEDLVRNDNRSALQRLAVLPPSAQKTNRVSAITLMALGEAAAKAYRNQQIDVCIDYVRRMVEILPTDEVVLRAYRELLAQRNGIRERTYEQKINVPELPEAPQALTAPVPVGGAVQPAMSDFDAMVKAFGVALGYYIGRKTAGASPEELRILLNQMKGTYGAAGVDMTFINMELAAQQPTPVVQPVVTPAATPAVVAPKTAPAKAKPATKPAKQPAQQPAAKPAVKPTRAATRKTIKLPANVDLDRAMRYYDEVVAREISDYERMELLLEISNRFGAEGSARVNKELERLKRRINQ